MTLASVDIITFLKYILVAFVQGVAEILPISSSGHIQVVERILQMDSSLSLSIFLHAGSLIAVILYFHKEIWSMIRYFFRFIFRHDRSEEAKRYFRMDIMLIIATIPAALIGVFLNDWIEKVFGSLLVVGINFLVTGVILILISLLKFERKIEEMSYLDAVLVGCAQAVGILPGISRSGITISGLKACKFNNNDAANFAFLMFIPISAGSFFYELLHIFKGESDFSSSLVGPYIVGILVAGVVTFLALHLLLKIIRKGKLWYFSIYLFIIGITVIVLSATHVL